MVDIQYVSEDEFARISAEVYARVAKAKRQTKLRKSKKFQRMTLAERLAALAAC